MLVDSEPASMVAWSTALTEMGAPATIEDMHRWIGLTDRDMAEYYAQQLESDVDVILEQANREFAARLHLEGLNPFEDAVSLIAEAESRGLAVGCATNSSRWRLDLVLRAASLDGRFAATVASDEVTRSKPHPDVYTKAIEQLGLDAGRTLVVEDSPVGIAAAIEAGCRVVAVDRGVFDRSRLERAHRVVTSLA